MDGQYLPMSGAKISVLDWGFLHSDATYDTVHVWTGRIFRLDLYLDRFLGGVERLRMKPPYYREKIASILKDCVALSGYRSAYVEMIARADHHRHSVAISPSGEPLHRVSRCASMLD
ncbi:hypothetical protein AJ88_35900 [Mesorhizobium amorphae CCBAU 01583]|nr:hypothetical protein AJ88_35900 [Mesorhizobium amorphae CCBAU 01583]